MNYKEYIAGVKDITAADEKFIEQYIAPIMKSSQTKVVNPMSGAEYETNPLIAALVYFTQLLAYSSFAPTKVAALGLTQGNSVQKYDRARYLILKLDRNIYSNVID